MMLRKSRKNILIFTVCELALASSLTSFADDTSTSDEADTSAGREIVLIEKAEEIIDTPQTYSYSAFGSPDPFKAPEVDLSVQNIGDKPTQAVGSMLEIAIKSPLQTELKNLTLTGIWQVQDGTRKALILAPKIAVAAGLGSGTRNRVGIVAKLGDPIGIMGKITTIEPDHIVVRQFKFDKDGTRTAADTRMYLDKINSSNVNKVIQFKGGEYKVVEGKSANAGVAEEGVEQTSSLYNNVEEVNKRNKMTKNVEDLLLNINKPYSGEEVDKNDGASKDARPATNTVKAEAK